MNEQPNNDHKNHHISLNILMLVISYSVYENITNKDSAKSIFDFLRMTREGNKQFKETKALGLIQKYEAFRMEGDEIIEEKFSRFQTFIASLKVLNKGYTTADHIEKMIRSLSKKWRPMIITLKVSKDLNSATLEELVSSLRSH